jgi:hypothetical protein
MFKKVLFSVLVVSSSLFAHSAIMSCFDNGDGSVTCEGGFSDGSSASGVNFYVEQGGKKVISGKMSEDSEFTFKKPSGTYSAVFDAGEGHQVHIKGSDITE